MKDTGKLPVDFSFQDSCRVILEGISRMAVSLMRRPYELIAIYRALLCEIRLYEIDKRPGRSYPRKKDRHRLKEQEAIVERADNVIYLEDRHAAA